MGKHVEIVSPAGNIASLRAAIEGGAEAVYAGFNDSTNARNFEGLNFTADELSEGLDYIKKRGKKLYLAINTFPQKNCFLKWENAVDNAVKIGPHALIMADLGVLAYTRKKYPHVNIHLSVQASASNYESINFHKKHFNIKRVILPRVHTIDEIRKIKENTGVEIEAFILGGLCINMEGRCYLSSFVTGASTNTEGVCSPSRFVRFENKNDSLAITLNGVRLNELEKGESSPYPTCCKGRYIMPDGRRFYAMEEPESLNALSMLPELLDAGVCALKIEGRQRTRKYVSDMTRVLRDAVDFYYGNPQSYKVKDDWTEKTMSAFEGGSHTLGPYGGK